jgi:type I restriction enzyme, R subunit
VNGAGQRYLIQHSAGSGKSFTIAWLAHRLSTLHDAADGRVFDSIVVITDRRVLDRQLQATMRQFEQTLGVVENIDTTSRQLREALELGKTIIVTTLQKFPVIAREIGELPGKQFAVIVDEAHSSQSGESTKSLKSVLASGSLEEAEAEEGEAETPEEELENAILAEMEKRGRPHRRGARSRRRSVVHRRPPWQGLPRRITLESARRGSRPWQAALCPGRAAAV